MATVLTFGHGTAGEDELVALLRGGGVGLVVDVRRFPGSRRHPHVATAEVERWLPAAGIDYRWDAGLGGRRRLPAGERDADPWWRVQAFRAYAAYARTADFDAALQRLLGDVRRRPEASVAVMCSESLGGAATGASSATCWCCCTTARSCTSATTEVRRRTCPPSAPGSRPTGCTTTSVRHDGRVVRANGHLSGCLPPDKCPFPRAAGESARPYATCSDRFDSPSQKPSITWIPGSSGSVAAPRVTKSGV
ncbi:hypothetical protein GCM10009844_04180 [Nocardioides koreensis]|uniref:Uncharacterized protein n=1 Tax=Nocardioides koreensis TaxID=433651 RepID=A0ABN2Z5V7_9ACTN